MSMFETMSVSGSNVAVRESARNFLAEAKRAARNREATRAKLQASTSIGMCRRTRTSSRLPISLNGVDGFTQDISVSGLYLVQSRQYEAGSKVDFLIDLQTSSGKSKLCCEGIVVRVEEVNGNFGLGIKILSQIAMSNN